MKKKYLMFIVAVLALSIYGCSGNKNASAQSEVNQKSNLKENSYSSEISKSSREQTSTSTTESPTPTVTPTPEPVLSDLNTVLSGANNNHWIYINGIVDNFRKFNRI